MNRKKLLTMLIKISVSALLFGWFFFTVDWHDIVRSFSQIKPLDVVFAISLIIITVVISVIKWRLLLKAQGFSLRWRDLWQVYWVGLFFNNFLPSSIGGDAMRVMICGEQNRRYCWGNSISCSRKDPGHFGNFSTWFVRVIFYSTSSPHLRILFLLLLFISIIVLWYINEREGSNFIKKRQEKINYFFYEFINHGGCFKKHPTMY